MAAPDLTFARAQVAGLMDKTACAVSRNPGGVEDDELDPETFELKPVEVEPWYDGPCLITVTGETDNGREGVGTVSLPHTAETDPELQLRRNDVVECTASENPGLIGRKWYVNEPIGGSFAVTRKATLSETRV